MWSVFKFRTAPGDSAAGNVVAPATGGAAGRASGDALAIWAKQIENVRQQTETAVVGLASRFGGIVEKLDRAISNSERESARHASEAVADGKQAEQQLSKVIDALRQLQSSRDELSSELSAIVGFTDELQKMADAVKMIAFQTNMLSINAAIEAAHAGESGKGFAVVAREVHKLSDASRETGQSINLRITAINDALRQVASHNQAANGSDHDAIRRSEESIRTVLARQHERMTLVSAAADDARGESVQVKNDLEESLVQLQFQDRVSQILAQVGAAMAEQAATARDPPLPAARVAVRAAVPAAGGGARVADLALARMAQDYTTEEQRRIHAGEEVGAAAPQEVTFF